MTRRIDDDAVKRRIWNIVEKWKYQGRKYDALLLESVIAQIVDTQPTLTPPNEPLTLDELRKGYNTPVWLSWYGDVQEWAFVRPYSKTHLEVLVFDGEADLVRIDEYRRSWVVYRRPPERQEDNNETD